MPTHHTEQERARMTDKVIDSEHNILTVGALRKMLDGVSDDIQIVIANDGWYTNISETVIPDLEQGEYSAVTFFPGVEYDARQF